MVVIIQGLPRFLVPALMSLLHTFLTSISEYEKDPDMTNFPWLNTLNTFIAFMEENYKLIVTKIFPRKRKTVPPKSSHSSTVHGQESDSDSSGNSSSDSETDSQSSGSSSAEEGSSHKKKKHKKSHKKKKSKKKSKKREKKRKVQQSQTNIKVGCKVVCYDINVALL